MVLLGEVYQVKIFFLDPKWSEFQKLKGTEGPANLLLNPRRNTVLPIMSDQCFKNPICRDFPIFLGNSACWPLISREAMGRSGGCVPPECGPQVLSVHLQQWENPARLPEQRCYLAGCPYPQLSSCPALPLGLLGESQLCSFQPRDSLSEEGLVGEIEEKKQHMSRRILPT